MIVEENAAFLGILLEILKRTLYFEDLSKWNSTCDMWLSILHTFNLSVINLVILTMSP